MRIKIFSGSSLIMDVEEAQYKAWVKRITSAGDWTWGLSWNEKIVKDVLANPTNYRVITDGFYMDKPPVEEPPIPSTFGNMTVRHLVD